MALFSKPPCACCPSTDEPTSASLSARRAGASSTEHQPHTHDDHDGCDHDHSHGEASSEHALRNEIILLSVCAALFFATLGFEQFIESAFGIWVLRLCYAVPYLLCGLSIFRQAFLLIFKGNVLNEFTLMCGATVAAIAIGALPEAVGVMLFYRVGEFFQERAAATARGSIRNLLASKPITARIVTEAAAPSAATSTVSAASPSTASAATPSTASAASPSATSTETMMSVEAVAVGQLLRVLPGEKIPLDGEVITGISEVDQSPLTGESLPVAAEPGSTVLGGAVNLSGTLTMRVTSRFADTHMARILEMVEHAAARKSPTERFISRFARYYTPVVFGVAVLIALLPPLFLPGATYSTWIYRALVMLVISCPCALIVSIPLGYFGGIGAASRQGILVKGGNVLDGLLHIDTVVFDKTGTLTVGAFEVTRLAPAPGISVPQLLAAAVTAEAHSNHPIARSIVRYAKAQGFSPAEGASAREVPGRGMDVTSQGVRYLVGTAQLLRENGIAIVESAQNAPDTPNVPDTQSPTAEAGALVHVCADATYLGCILASDALKSDARQAIADLRSAGLKTWMLTGDRRAAAVQAARTLDLDGFEAELLPEGKVEAMQRIAGESRTAFVGDGINDAPILAISRVGIAMGGMGSEAAIEAADAVILNDSPAKVASLFKIARRVRNVVRQNIILALGIKTAFMVFGVAGLSGLWEAVFADVGVALLAVLNASRIMRK